MATITKTHIQLGGKERTLVCINHKEEDELKEVVECLIVDRVHVLQILDRSGSMSNDIRTLIDNVIKTLEVVGENDLISVIWFSGPGQYKTLVKGMKKSDDLVNLLNSIRFTLGTTCFSEPLKEANVVIDDLLSICPNVMVNLFTDGQPVTNWSVEDEIKRIMVEVEKMKVKVIAINTIGYGRYTNEELLHTIASQSEFGVYCHSNYIDEYLTIFTNNFERVMEVTGEGIEVVSPHTQVLYLTRNFTKLEDGEFTVTRSDKRKNQMFLLAPEIGNFNFTYQGVEYHTKDIKDKPVEATVNNFFYAYAYNLYYAGNRQETLDILNTNVKDKYLVDKLMKSFTVNERADFTREFSKMLFSPVERYKDGKTKDNYVPKADAFCVMDLLKILQESDSKYLPFSRYADKYNRIGKKVEDVFNVFTLSKEETKATFSDIIYHEERLNMSLRFFAKGIVSINPATAKRVNLPQQIESGIWRNHTLIKDGMLNMNTFVAEITKTTFSQLCQAENETDIEFMSILEDGDDTVIVKFDVMLLPIINRTYINKSSLHDILETTIKINEFESTQKVLKYLISNAKESKSILVKEDKFAGLTLEQINVLKEHGLDEHFWYNSVERKDVIPEGERDFYETRAMSFTIKDFSGLPKVQDVLLKMNESKKLTPSVALMGRVYNDIYKFGTSKKIDMKKPNVKLRDFLEEQLNDTKNSLRVCRAQLASQKLAKLVTGDWFKGIEIDAKGKEFYAEDETIMYIKTKRERVYL